MIEGQHYLLKTITMNKLVLEVTDQCFSYYNMCYVTFSATLQVSLH